MSKFLGLLLALFSFQFSFAAWKPEQLTKANTAKNITYLNKVEKDAIMYINLARLYPKEFVINELAKYGGPPEYGGYVKNSPYKKTLTTKLNSMKALKAFKFDKLLYEDAKCFSKEQGESGKEGHERKTCKAGIYAENCSYGMPTGKDVAMQWLIDHNVPSLGHRKTCLSSKYTKIGVSHYTHKVWKTCCIGEFI
jgi:hypothetical protein